MVWRRGSKTETCLFCGQPSTTLTEQKIPVCGRHKERTLENLKCVCKSYLDLLQGKFGPFFKCFNCGTMNLKKAVELNPSVREQKTEHPLNRTQTLHSVQTLKKIVQKEKVQNSPQEQLVRSDDPTFFD